MNIVQGLHPSTNKYWNKIVLEEHKNSIGESCYAYIHEGKRFCDLTKLLTALRKRCKPRDRLKELSDWEQDSLKHSLKRRPEHFRFMMNLIFGTGFTEWNRKLTEK